MTNVNHDDFANLVSEDVRAFDDTKKNSWLRESEQLDAWHDALVRLLRSVDLQFTGKRMEINRERVKCTPERPKVTIKNQDGDTIFEGTWQEYIAYVASWRVKTNRFKSAIEERLAEVKSLRRLNVPKEMVSVHAVETIVKAIRHHHDVVTEDNDEVDDVAADEQLWATLDRPEVTALMDLLLGAAA